MEAIKSMAVIDRPREKLQAHGAQALSDAELMAILLGSGTPQVPLHLICENLLKDAPLGAIAHMDLATLCQFKGIGPAKATIILAAAEFSRRVESKAMVLADENAYAGFLRPLLLEEAQLQFRLVLLNDRREVLAFAEAGSLLPDITWLTELAIKAGATRLLLGRNGWPVFSNTEGRYLQKLQAACAALNVICEGLMAVGPERFKMI